MCIIRASSTAAPGGFGAIGAESSRIGGSLRVLSVHPTRFCVAKRFTVRQGFFREVSCLLARSFFVISFVSIAFIVSRRLSL
jgi:hypothetical protein